jgi:hypothetical protein
MNEIEFWALVGQANKEPNVSWEDRYRLVAALLNPLSRESLVDYTVLFSKAREQVFTPRVICGAHLIYEGTLSDDSFLDFSDSLVALGQEAFKRVVTNADSLIDYLELAHCPSMFFWMAAIKSYNAKRKRSDSPLEDFLPPLPCNGFDHVFYNGRQGLDVACRENCEMLTPNLAARFGGAIW